MMQRRLTTLETNRDSGCRQVSKAPPPSVRYLQFKALDWPKKVGTVEPVFDFDLDIFSMWLTDLNPLYVWLGYNSRPKEIRLNEPSREKVDQLIQRLRSNGIEVKEKEM